MLTVCQWYSNGTLVVWQWYLSKKIMVSLWDIDGIKMVHDCYCEAIPWNRILSLNPSQRGF